MTKDTEADIRAHDPNGSSNDAAEYMITDAVRIVRKYGRHAGWNDTDIRTRLLAAFDRAAEKGA